VDPGWWRSHPADCVETRRPGRLRNSDSRRYNVNDLTAREVWTFRLAPFATAIVWSGLVVAGNRRWIAGWFTDRPFSVICALTLITWLFCLALMPIVKRCYRRWRTEPVNVGARLFTLSVLLGAACGAFFSMTGPGLRAGGVLCGVVLGLVLATGLGRCVARYRRQLQGAHLPSQIRRKHPPDNA
jgi:hypothetical protein